MSLVREEVLSKPVFLVEGQGSVSPYMGKAEYENLAIYKKCIDEISEYASENIPDLLWGSKRFQLKTNPYFAHLGLFASAYALFCALTDVGVEPAFLSGHSLGEVIAIVLAGALPLDKGVNLIKKRGELFLQNASVSDSDMVALVGENRYQISCCVDNLESQIEIYTANLNSPRQIVVSCRTKDIQKIMAKAAELKLRSVKLNVKNGCHSPFVAGINQELSQFIDTLEFREPIYPIYSTSFNRELKEAQDLRQSLNKHLLAQVVWEDSIRSLLDKGFSDFIQLGFSKVLKGLILDIDRRALVRTAPEILRKYSQ